MKQKMISSKVSSNYQKFDKNSGGAKNSMPNQSINSHLMDGLSL